MKTPQRKLRGFKKMLAWSNAVLIMGAYSAQKFGKNDYYEAMMKAVTGAGTQMITE